MAELATPAVWLLAKIARRAILDARPGHPGGTAKIGFFFDFYLFSSEIFRY